MTSTNKPSSIFIIGAAKCGTTALADILDQHPNISLSEPKEPDFFSDRVFTRGLEWYEGCFHHGNNVKYRIDASVCYSLGWGPQGSENIAKRIMEYDKDAILIYLVRDPVQRAWASYWHDVRNLKVKESADASILNAESAHFQGGMYYQRLSEYLKYFSKDKILVFNQETLMNEPKEVLSQINKLTQLDSLTELADTANKRVNSSYQFNKTGQLITKIVPIDFIKRLAHLSNRCLPSAVNNLIRNQISKPIPKIDNNLAERLIKLYADDSELLFKEFGIEVRTGTWWGINKKEGD